MKLNAMKIDVDILENGEWVDTGIGDVQIKVRGYGNSAQRRLSMKVFGKLTPAQRDNLEKNDATQARILSEAILLDWRNIADDNGEPLPFSREKAVEMLLDPTLVKFKEAVQLAAQEVADRAAASLSDDSGN